MNEFIVNLSVFMMIACFFGGVIVFGFVNYHLYRYLLEKGKVKGYWDFNAYVYGRKNGKKYKIIWDKSVNDHPHLKKARLYLILYWGMMLMVLVCLFTIIGLSG